MKNVIVQLFLIIAGLLFVACGGEVFTAPADDSGIGGQGGEPAVEPQEPPYVATPGEFTVEPDLVLVLDGDDRPSSQVLGAALREWARAVPFGRVGIRLEGYPGDVPTMLRTDGLTRIEGGVLYVNDDEPCALATTLTLLGRMIGGIREPLLDTYGPAPTPRAVMQENHACSTQVTRDDVEWLADALRNPSL